MIDPDYNGRSGDGVRITGFCASRGEVLTVLVHKPTGYDINGWPSNSKDCRIYREGGTP